MAEPKKKRSKTRARRARAGQRREPLNLVTCAGCGAQIVPHTVCPHCGYYGNKAAA